ncbi:hypothetical protein CY34DRAFT_25499 [Suillus luteus UH-Slu-Lm8-n1]|uniref:Uncharacterized protein n=1 Tax=Suillus luteus UH-Slu-Lm8-n1 TaxID=930992 RepID=A0A0D0AAK5_9AGAM|nr:hypothetical protein CY34DRAFT_25499 [Suillus luteus UH-Slu-Lm8-n1]
MDVDAVPYTAPPGDEVFDLSHVGGEHEAFEGLIHQMADLTGCRYIDSYTCHERPLPSHHYPNETLIYYGYIGCSPMYPAVAISLQTLAAYRQSHRTCPCFSIQVQCKTLCFLHDIPYRPYLKTQFTAAYDIYLEILHCVNTRLRWVLSQDTPNWCLLNSCPACFYKLEDEPALDFEWLVSIDGNNSLKRWDLSNDDWQDDSDTDTNIPGAFTCVNRWRNAGPETRKKMFSVFYESGIFITSCHHYFILLACDMI